MRRVLTDGSGRWFDLRTAERYEEATFWDGRNRRSCATGSQWEHEELFRTASGCWVLHRWSQWQGTTDSWDEITPPQAAKWLLQNGYDLPDTLAEYAEKLRI